MDKLMLQAAVILFAVLVVAPFVQSQLLKLSDLMAPPPTAAQICARNPKWTVKDCYRIAAGKVWLGMTEDMARESLGEPWVVNSCSGEWGVLEEWIYKAGYLYFENGVLARWDGPEIR